MKKQVWLFAAASILALASCSKDDKPKDKIFKGPEQTFQHGKSWTWYEENGKGDPMRIAIVIDDEAMASLDRNTGNGHSHVNAVSLKLHPEAGATPFTHALLDWNPHGHEPAPIYDKPHFDFHFYTSTEAERLAIPTYEAAKEKFDNHPAPAYFPGTYIPGPGGVPQMGVHWLDATAPELNGSPFTQTFIYGSYDGKVTFYEPMITEEFIKNNHTFVRDIPQPAKVQKSGWYPTKMRFQKKDGATHFILESFVKREAS